MVGNLPYNISTPILFHLLGFAHLIADQHFMLQKEVIDRMVARPATSDYSRLSVMLQWRYAMENILFVPPESFEPPPRVDSAMVRMVPLAQPPVLDATRLGEIVQVAFSQRRKLLRHTLGKWLDEHGFSGSFDTQRRAEEVPVAEYVALAQAVPPAPAPSSERAFVQKSPSSTGFFHQAAASQYPALKGLLMRSASGDTSTNLSVGIFSAVGSSVREVDADDRHASPLEASFARSAWLV